MAAKPKPSGFQKFQKGTPPSTATSGVRKGSSSAASPKKGGALPAKTAKPIKGKNRKGSK